MKRICQEKINVVATDYDLYMVERAKELFPEISVKAYDFYKDDIEKIVEEYKVDTVVLFGAACSMDNTRYIEFSRTLKELKSVKFIYTFEAGVESEICFGKRILVTILVVIKNI